MHKVQKAIQALLAQRAQLDLKAQQVLKAIKVKKEKLAPQAHKVQ